MTSQITEVPFEVMNDEDSGTFEVKPFIMSEERPLTELLVLENKFFTLSPDWRVTLMNYTDLVEQKTNFNNYDSEKTYIIENPDLEKCSPFVRACVEQGVPIGYVSRFNFSTTGSTALCQFTRENGDTFSINWKSSTYQYYDNIPVAVLFNTPETGAEGNVPAMTFSTTGSHQAVLYEPYNRDERWNIDYQRENDLLYKFEVYEAPSGATLETKIFDDATESLIHVIKGHLFVDGTMVDSLKFYKHDATESTTLQAGIEGFSAVQLTKVSDIVLP